MIANKTLFSKTMFTAALMLLPLLVTSPARASGNHQVEITFTKWITSFPSMEGFTGGEVPGAFEGTLFQVTPLADGRVIKLDAEYEIIADDPAHSFKARVSGSDNNVSNHAALNGVVTEGWRAGAQVHVEFQTVPCAHGYGYCFDGTIRIQGN